MSDEQKRAPSHYALPPCIPGPVPMGNIGGMNQDVEQVMKRLRRAMRVPWYVRIWHRAMGRRRDERAMLRHRVADSLVGLYGSVPPTLIKTDIPTGPATFIVESVDPETGVATVRIGP